MQRFLLGMGRPVRVRAGARTAATMAKQFALGLAPEGRPDFNHGFHG